MTSWLISILCTSMIYASEPRDHHREPIEISPARQSKSLALYGFQAHGLTKAQVDVFTKQLSASLAASGHFRVLESQRMEDVLQEQGFSSSGSTDEAIEIGRRLKVDYILTGSFAKSSGRFYGTAELINTQTAQVEHRSRVGGNSGEAVFINQNIPTLARKIEETGFIFIYPPLKTAAWVTSGVSLLALGAGLFFESQAQSSFSDFRADPNQRTLAGVERWQVRRDFAYATAGSLALGALVLWFWPEKDSTHPRASHSQRQDRQSQLLSPWNWSPVLNSSLPGSYGLQLQRRF